MVLTTPEQITSPLSKRFLSSAPSVSYGYIELYDVLRVRRTFQYTHVYVYRASPARQRTVSLLISAALNTQKQGVEGIPTEPTRVNAVICLDDCTPSTSWYHCLHSLIIAWIRSDPKLNLVIDDRLVHSLASLAQARRAY